MTESTTKTQKNHTKQDAPKSALIQVPIAVVTLKTFTQQGTD